MEVVERRFQMVNPIPKKRGYMQSKDLDPWINRPHESCCGDSLVFITYMRYADFTLFQHPEQAIPMIPSCFQP